MEEEKLPEKQANDIVPKTAQVELLTPDRVKKEQEHIELLQKFVKANLQEKVDFGIIPGSIKPTLYKAGAEKMANLFSLGQTYEIVKEVEDWDKEFFFYRYRCKLFNKNTGNPVGEGIGSANTKETSRKGRNPVDIVNVVDKMAQKRAFVAAILSACNLSMRFTQDLEDMKPATTQVNKELASKILKCQYKKCKKDLTPKIADYSVKNFQGKMYCFDHQRDMKKEESDGPEQPGPGDEGYEEENV